MLKLEDLSELLAQHRDTANARVAEFSIDGVRFDFNSRPAIMGVINLSAESWYRESVCLSTERAIERGTTLHVQGAQVVDIGAESTLAHAKRIDEGAQSKQLLPIIRGLRERKILVSVETYHASVARDCLEAGANVINLTGSAGSTDIFKMAATHRAAVIICYVQGSNVREVADFDFGSDPVQLMYDYFARQIELARKCGVEKIFIDPGLGFYYRNLQDSAVRVRHQMRIFLNSFRLRKLGHPVCHALPHAFEYFGEEVRSAEPFFAVLAALGKTDLFRTHEVPKTRGVLETLAVY
ncbi:MAG TPA: dihydropteroate synthase [Verrucomicrobiae bacterium]|nr:dihydropteroate synthase [Verrucomicrobiae bacterium]